MINDDDLDLIIGIDEVGRGCLAGPVVAAAVILNNPIQGLKDSKQLSKAKREKLSNEINISARSVGVGWTEIDVINKIGLTASIKNAMEMALSKIKTNYSTIIIDGNYNFLSELPKVSVVVSADSIYPSVSAASIIAKVYRDNWMKKLAFKYPNYGFEQHVGYGTKLHLERLKQFGPCPEHRMFYKPLLAYGRN